MSKQYTVLEFNDHSLKIVVGRQFKSYALIERVITTVLPENIRPDQGLFDPAVVGPYLKDIFYKLSLKNKRIIVSMANRELTSYIHNFPKTSNKDLSSEIESYLANSFPLHKGKLVWVYKILKVTKHEQTILINAIHPTLVQSLYASIERAGLTPVACLPLSISLGKAVLQADTINILPPETSTSFGLFDIHENSSSMSLFQDGILIFNSILPTENRIESTAFLGEIFTAYTQHIKSLAKHGFLITPERFYLSGSMKDPLKARNLLELKLNKTVDIIWALGSVRASAPQPACINQELATAGCLLSAPPTLQANSDFFTPLHALKQQRTRSRRSKSLLVGASALSLVLALSFGLSYQNKLDHSKERLQRLQSDLQQLQLSEVSSSSENTYLTLEATQIYHDRVLATESFISNQSRISSEQLLSLTRSMPPDIILKSLTVESGQIDLSCNADTIESIARYEYLLKDLPFITDVFILSVSDPNRDVQNNSIGYSFIANCYVRRGGDGDET